MFKLLNLSLLCCSFLGCATARKSRLLLTGASFVAGGVIGASTTPEDERRELHALYGAGLAGVAAAVAGEFLFNDDESGEKARLENEKLRAELELVQNANKVLLKEGQGYFKNNSGEQLFQSGRARWRLYQTDRWVKDGPQRLYHQDKMVELAPEDSK